MFLNKKQKVNLITQILKNNRDQYFEPDINDISRQIINIVFHKQKYSGSQQLQIFKIIHAYNWHDIVWESEAADRILAVNETQYVYDEIQQLAEFLNA